VVAISTAIIQQAVPGIELKIGFSAVTGISMYSEILLVVKKGRACIIFIRMPPIKK